MNTVTNNTSPKTQPAQSSTRQEQVSTVLFDTEYKRKLKITDWFHTKTALYIIAAITYWIYAHELDGRAIAIIGGVVIFFYMRDSTLLHEKDKMVWGIIKKGALFSRLSEISKKSLHQKALSQEGKDILLATMERENRKKTVRKSSRGARGQKQ